MKKSFINPLLNAQGLKTLIVIVSLLSSLGAKATPLPSDSLRIYCINVGWGNAVLIIGPDGKTILYDGGEKGMGKNRVVPFLKSIGIQPTDGIDYMFASHQHADHITGLTETLEEGYDIKRKVYYNGSTYTANTSTNFINAASKTTGGLSAIPLGTEIPLGKGAKATCIAVKGSVLGIGPVRNNGNENDLSIALLIQYNNFEYIIAGDMGGGYADSMCTGRHTSAPISTRQCDIESYIAKTILPGGANPLITSAGIEVMQINHHGSESSTNSTYYNLLKPTVALISTGAGQKSDFQLPRINVVDTILKAKSKCITALACDIYQTEEGDPMGTKTSTTGYCVGNITISTDGLTSFRVSADGAVSKGPNELNASGLPKTYSLTGDITPPTISAITVTNITNTSATINWITNEPADSQIEYDTIKATYKNRTPLDITTILNHRVTINGLKQGKSYYYKIKTKDKAGNMALSGELTFTTTATPGILFSTVLYDPTEDENLYEWFELYNTSSTSINVGGWKIIDNNGCGTSYTIPTGTTIPGKTTFTIAKSRTEFNRKYGFYPDLSNLTLGLNNDGDALILKSETALIIDQVAWEGGAKTGSSCGIPISWGSTTLPNASEGKKIYRSSLLSDNNDYKDWQVGLPLLPIATELLSTNKLFNSLEFNLEQNTPNPFSIETSINFTIPTSSLVLLEVYDINGILVKTLVNAEKEAGNYTVLWNGQNDDGKILPNGIYKCELITDYNRAIRKIIYYNN